MVLCQILKSLTPSIVQIGLNFEAAKQLWDKLKERFSMYRLADL